LPSLKKKILLFLSILLTFTFIGGGLWGKGLVTRWAHQKAEELLKTRVDFSDLQIGLVSRSVTLKDVQIYHPDRKNEKIGEISKMVIHLESLHDLFHKSTPIEIQLDHLKLVFATTPSGDWELSDRLPLMRRGQGEARLTPFDVDKISVDDGELEFHDGRVGTLIKLTKIQFHADHFQRPTPEDLLPIPFEAHFFVGNSGEIQMKGKGDFLSPKTSLKADLTVESLPLPPYAAYYERGLPVHVTNGLAYFTAKVECDQDILRIPIHASVSDLQVALKEHKSFGFVADYKLDSMKDENGRIGTDLRVSGDLRHPKIAFLTKFDVSVGEGAKAFGHKIKSFFSGSSAHR
jgi:uncharacterized protein DUF748